VLTSGVNGMTEFQPLFILFFYFIFWAPPFASLFLLEFLQCSGIIFQVKPNRVTFIGVLSACAHCGLVSEGRRFWLTMQELGIEPMMEHYGCMVDLQCRAGCFEEARSFVNSMPIIPNSIIWRTLLVGWKNSKSFDKKKRVHSWASS